MKTVFVVGAGPAGMFAAQRIALANHQVFIFNRDIKYDGLAEYGIDYRRDWVGYGNANRQGGRRSCKGGVVSSFG